MDNALKFTENGSIQLSACLEDSNPEMTTLKIAVQDSGVGMDQDNLDMIFSAFSQVDDSTTRLHDGIGLGLIIVKKLTDMLSGKINTQSELGAGSLFRSEFLANLLQQKKFPSLLKIYYTPNVSLCLSGSSSLKSML